MSSLPMADILLVYPNFYIDRDRDRDRIDTYPCSFPSASAIEQIEFPPPYISFPKKLKEPENIEKIKDIKDHQKLRLVNGCLEIDTRNCLSIKRFLSRDSRWKVLDYFKSSFIDYKDYETVMYILEKLCNTTYKDDKKWIISIKELIDKKYRNPMVLQKNNS